MPKEACPAAELVSPRSASSFITMAVEERASKQPVNTPSRQLTPKRVRRAVVRAKVSPTWSPPPTKMSRAMRARRSRLNSIPMVKRRSTTPISAAALMSWGSRTIPSALGPMMTPASRKLTMGTSPSRKETKAIPALMAISAASSPKNAGPSPAAKAQPPSATNGSARLSILGRGMTYSALARSPANASYRTHPGLASNFSDNLSAPRAWPSPPAIHRPGCCTPPSRAGGRRGGWPPCAAPPRAPPPAFRWPAGFARCERPP